jgi:tetratricopeptide (TPR) repeat protein
MLTAEQAQKLMQAGNYKEAYEAFRARALDPVAKAEQVGSDLQQATQCLQNLARTDEIDDFREAVIKQHAGNWKLLRAAGQNYQQVEHFGYRIAGKFVRGSHRGGGEPLNSTARDRVRALQLFEQAMNIAIKENKPNELGQFYLQLAQEMLGQYGYGGAWRLQLLTDLKSLPDYEPGWHYHHHGDQRGAPVDAEGNPIYYVIPKSWGRGQERWRTLSLVFGASRRIECRAAQRVTLAVRAIPLQSIRRADLGSMELVFWPRPR